jgi:hypothetical protein
MCGNLTCIYKDACSLAQAKGLPSVIYHEPAIEVRFVRGAAGTTSFLTKRENQGAELFADTLPCPYLADSGDPRPIQTKSRSMPVHDGSRSDQDERLGAPGPERSQRNPEQFVQGSQSTARLLRVQSQQLPTESQVLEDEVLPERKTLTNQPRKCRSDTIMARILAEKSESSFAPSHSFCRCTTFWRGTASRTVVLSVRDFFGGTTTSTVTPA